VTGDARVDFGHVSCSSGEQINILPQEGDQLCSDQFRKILSDLEVLRGVVSRGDQLEFSIGNRPKKFRVERILLFLLMFLKVFLGESRVKFASRELAVAFPLSSADLLDWETEFWVLLV